MRPRRRRRVARARSASREAVTRGRVEPTLRAVGVTPKNREAHNCELLRRRGLASRIACSDVLCKPERHSPGRVCLDFVMPPTLAHPLDASRTQALRSSSRPGRRLLRPYPVRGPDGDRDTRRGDKPQRQMSHRRRKQHSQEQQNAKRPQQGLCKPAHCPASPQFHCATTFFP